MTKPNYSNPLFFNVCFDKGELKNLIAWFLDHYGEKFTIDFLEILKEVGFHQATVAGISLGLDDLQIPELKSKLISDTLIEIQLLRQKNNRGNITSVEKSQRMIDTWNQTSEILRQTTIQNFRLTNPVNPIYMMAFSGARGNISQVRQLVAMRGLMADPQGAILEFPIQSNFREGLTLTEYLISCYGARKGLVDTALRTATSGYLTRRLVDAVQHVVVTIIDCGSQKGIFLKDKNLAVRLIGRVLAENIIISSKHILQKNLVISPFLAKQLSLKFNQILVRSPLTCQAEKSVCQLCYGWNLAHGKLVSIGDAVGIIAAQSIGEPGTQLTMRTFHTGGVGVFSDQVTKLFTAPFEGYIEFIEKLPGLFVRTPHGHVVYMVKSTSIASTRIILQVKNENVAVYSITEKELPPGSLLWVKQGEFVTNGQIIAQASQIKTYKQQLPESLHPVQSPIDGEIHFEFMKIVKQKQLQLKTKKRKNTETGIAANNRTLLELGSFWVLGASIQKEFHNGKIFLRRGDLISKQTPLFQYNFHLFQQAQLRTIEKTLSLGFTYFNLQVLDIRFHKTGYFLNPILSEQKRKKSDLFFYRKSSFKTSTNYSLIWYPEIFIFKQAGYVSSVKNYFQNFSNSSQNNLSIEQKFILNTLEQACGSFFLDKQSLSFVSYKQKKERFSKNFFNNMFLFTKTNGLCQLQIRGKSASKIKKSFSFFFYKNVTGSFTSQSNSFLISALKQSSFAIFCSSKNLILKKTKDWVLISDEKKPKSRGFLQLFSIILEPGKSLHHFAFSKKHTSLSTINSSCLQIFDSEKIMRPGFSWYSISELFNFRFTEFNLKKLHFNKKQFFDKPKGFVYETKKLKRYVFVFYKIKKSFFLSLKSKVSFPFRKIYLIKSQTQFLLVKNLRQYFIPQKRSLSKNSIPIRNFHESFRVTSPLSTKQTVSQDFKKKTPVLFFRITSPTTSTWLSPQPIFQVQLKFIFDSKYFFNYKHNPVTLYQRKLDSLASTRALNLFLYDEIVLNNVFQFKFRTFPNNWIVFENNITKGFIKTNQRGEFQKSTSNENKTILSILEPKGLVTLKISTFNQKCCLKNFTVGSFIRWGDEINCNFAYHLSGQILTLTPMTVKVRHGIPILASSRGILHVFHNDLIEKNQLLITLKSRRFQTEDIVQGIPKIEQLFEARETQGGELIANSVHTKLQNLFVTALQSQNLKFAVLESVQNIQKFLIENILEAYSNQGVKISEKHVEIIVRQMTTRVRIIIGGDTGLLPGELVQLTWIQELNKKLQFLGYREATYEPIVLGITKSVLQSESFLLAASFQEVSRVLVRSALSKKTDFLRGLHENVILGQLIPAGTGLLLDGLNRNVSELKFQLPF